MNNKVILSLGLIAISTMAFSQQQASLSSTLKIYVFPTAGQAADQQQKDEGECFQWAVGNSGVDPFQLDQQAAAQKEQVKQQEQQAKQATQGTTAKSTLGGAAAGALIGEMGSGDSSQGAAYGAAAGAIMGRRKTQATQQQATQSAEQQIQQIDANTAQSRQNFNNAFSVCLEAKKYLVKF